MKLILFNLFIFNFQFKIRIQLTRQFAVLNSQVFMAVDEIQIYPTGEKLY